MILSSRRSRVQRRYAATLPIALSLLFGGAHAGQAAPPPGFHLVWSDEFHDGVGNPPSATWKYQLGGNNANNEKETYVNDLQHVQIVADPDATDGQALQILSTNTHGYESVRMSTAGKQTFQYGFVEARIKMPYGQGIWPAFWMLGANIDQTGWPACGEIDIMENGGRQRDWGENLSTLHSLVDGTKYGDFSRGGVYRLPEGQYFHDRYHLFQMLWVKNSISFYVDGNLFETHTAAEYSGGTWPFNAPFFFLLNTAIGGGLPGDPDATTPFPQKMLVDYVRVYKGELPQASRPKSLQAAPVKDGQIRLVWKTTPYATSYSVYRGMTSGHEGATPVKTGIVGTTYLDIALPGGKFYYKVAAVNSHGPSRLSPEAAAAVKPALELPHGGKPWSIPGVIQAEDFDEGGEGVGYHVLSDHNNGGAYRTTEAVGIEALAGQAGGYDVGWASSGQWLRYTVNVTHAGTYQVTFRASSGDNGGTFHLEDEHGRNLTGAVHVPATGGWQNWQPVVATATLAQGSHRIKLVEDTDGYNLDWMSFAQP